MIIGVTGTMGAGKDTVANYLVKKWGFVHHSCSDVLRDELALRQEKENRDRLRALGNELRSRFGAGVLGERILQKILKDQENKSVVTSLRHPDEIKAIKKGSDFSLLAVDAPVDLRYARVQKRNRPGDNVELAEFKRQEAREMHSRGESQQIGACILQADYQLLNDRSFPELYQQIDKIITKLLREA